MQWGGGLPRSFLEYQITLKARLGFGKRGKKFQSLIAFVRDTLSPRNPKFNQKKRLVSANTSLISHRSDVSLYLKTLKPLSREIISKDYKNYLW